MVWKKIHNSDITGIQRLREFSFNGNSSTLLQALYSLNARPPDLECQKTLRFGLKLTSSLHISSTSRFCQLLGKCKSSLISTFSEYTYESTGLWNWRECLRRLRHWHCEKQVPEHRTSIECKKLVELTPQTMSSSALESPHSMCAMLLPPPNLFLTLMVVFQPCKSVFEPVTPLLLH